jgi:cobalamin biosynthesis protein CobT
MAPVSSHHSRGRRSEEERGEDPAEQDENEVDGEQGAHADEDEEEREEDEEDDDVEEEATAAVCKAQSDRSAERISTTGSMCDVPSSLCGLTSLSSSAWQASANRRGRFLIVRESVSANVSVSCECEL